MIRRTYINHQTLKAKNCVKLKLSTKSRKPNSKTMGFIEIEDNNQNVRWACIKQKIIEGETQTHTGT
jgi:hypothetical protein